MNADAFTPEQLFDHVTTVVGLSYDNEKGLKQLQKDAEKALATLLDTQVKTHQNVERLAEDLRARYSPVAVEEATQQSLKILARFEKALEDSAKRIQEIAVAERRAIFDRDRWRLHTMALASITFLFGVFLSPVFARTLPPAGREVTALIVLGGTAWEAGSELLRASDPSIWDTIANGLEIERDNKEALARCHAAAGKAGKPQPCSISVQSGPT